jgi:hypothetical protein
MSIEAVVPLHESEERILAESMAQQITSRIRTWVKAFPAADVACAYQGRIWLAMGYESWSEWCDCELGGFKVPPVQRREIVAELAESEMSNVAIADVIGVSRETVRRDLAGCTNVHPDRKLTGQDGKKYRRPVPKREQPAADPNPEDRPPPDINGEDIFCKRAGSFDLAFRIARKKLESLVIRRTPEEAEKVRKLLMKSLRDLEKDQKEGGR